MRAYFAAALAFVLMAACGAAFAQSPPPPGDWTFYAYCPPNPENGESQYNECGGVYEGAELGAFAVITEVTGADAGTFTDYFVVASGNGMYIEGYTDIWIGASYTRTAYVRAFDPAGDGGGEDEETPRITVEDAVEVGWRVLALFAAVFAIKMIARAARS